MANEGTESVGNSIQARLGMSPLALAIPILNTLALLATLGVFYYSRIKFKRPPITEETERVRLAKISAAPPQEMVQALIEFEPVTVNIASTPLHPHAADGTSQQIQGKLHYATVAFSLEIRDRTQQELIDAARPAILDQLILLLGKKQFHELTTVQGRYILHSQIIEFTNKLIATSGKGPRDGLVSNLYFSQFLIQ